MPRLLLVDDDPHLLQALKKLLGIDGHSCHTAANATQARAMLDTAAEDSPFDLMILDVALPDLNGLTLCRQLRQNHHLPILMLTARSGVEDKVLGLEMGADDYLAKPFDPRELLAHVHALLRRASEYSQRVEPERLIQSGELVVDPDARDAFLCGKAVGLTDREFELLYLLARHQGRALSSAWIYETIWGLSTGLGLKTLTVHIQRVRQKIENDPRKPRLLVTIRGYGYRLVGDAKGDATD